jgi:hypothetical protein
VTVPGRPASQTPPHQRSAEEISTLVQSAGLIEQARAMLKYLPHVDQGMTTSLKRISDILVAEAAGQKITIANDFVHKHGQE